MTSGSKNPSAEFPYLFFFLSGAASLTNEILWTRQFVPVFGNSSYAITEERNPECLDVLASAYATLGNFTKASEIARKAYNLALSLNLKQLAEDIKKRLDTFEKFQ